MPPDRLAGRTPSADSLNECAAVVMKANLKIQ
jgi:hypothetical protein